MELLNYPLRYTKRGLNASIKSTHRVSVADYIVDMTEEEFTTEIGARIAEARKTRGMTQDQLARETGLKKSRISMYERGNRTPGPFEITLIGKALSSPAAYLMCIDEEKPASDLNLNPRVDDLPEVFKEAIRLKVERLVKIFDALPVSVINMFKAPTSDSYASWERGIEDSYKSFTGKDDLYDDVLPAITYGRRSTDSIKGDKK